MNARWLLYTLVFSAIVSTSSCQRTVPSTIAIVTEAAGDGAPRMEDLDLSARVDLLLEQRKGETVDSFQRIADTRKANGRFKEAAVYYLAGLRLEPKHVMCRYQLACNLELWGHRRLALDTLRQLVNDGFWGFEMMRTDEDFDSLKSNVEFQSLLSAVKERYAREADKRVGACHLHVPRGSVPANGWPLVILLHGMGDHADAYQSMAQEAADAGYAGLAVSGPIVHWEQRHAWPSESFSDTHRHLQSLIAKLADRKELNRDRVYLVGFSQGAVHAAGLTASFPGAYAGCIVVSPGGEPGVPTLIKAPELRRPACVIHGKKELVGNILEANRCVSTWKNAAWPVLEETHPDGHQFPSDWTERFPRLMKWVSETRRP